MLRSAACLGVLLLAALSAHAGDGGSCRSCDYVLGKDRILYATAATAGRIDAFCVGTGGRLSASTHPSIGGLDHPNRLIVDKDNHRLYVAEGNTVVAYRISATGGLTRLWHFPSSKDLATEAFKSTGLRLVDLALASDCQTLYVPAQHPGRILALTDLEAPDPTISSCVQGPIRPSYRNLIAEGDVLYSSGAGFSGRIDAFRLGQNGVLPGTWDTDDGGDCRPHTQKCIPPAGTKCDSCGGAGQKACPAGCPAQCPIPRPDVTAPDSTRRRLSRPVAFQILDSPPNAPPGSRFLYVAERGVRALLGFQLRPDGLFDDVTRDGSVPQKPFTRLHTSANYLDLVARSSDDPNVLPTLVGSQFNNGFLTSFVLAPEQGDDTVDPGECHTGIASLPSVCLPKKPKGTTGKDLRLSPVRMQICRDGGTIPHDWVYVATGILDRIRAIRLSPKGRLETETLQETAERKNSFPNDVAVAVLEGNCQ